MTHHRGQSWLARTFGLFAAAPFALAVSLPASAQFNCTTTATDVTCNNSGTAVSETNFDLTKNVTTNNSGTVTTFISTGTGNSGNATTTNWGSVGTDIGTTAATSGNAATTNYGSIGGSVDTIAISGSAIGINYGTVGGHFNTLSEFGGPGNAINYGSIGGTFNLTGVFVSTTLANYGSVGSISVSSPNGGTATTTSTGSVATSITTLGFTGATTTNSGSVGTSISTTTIGNGPAVTTNWGSVGTNISTLTASGGAVTVTNYGRIGGFINATSAIGGDATVTNYGSVGGNMQALAVFGTATAANYGTAGSLTASSPTEDAIAINSGRVSGQVSVFGSTRQTLTNSGTINNSGGTAILFVGASPTTLTLLPGSFIVGAINFNAGAANRAIVDVGNVDLTFNTLANVPVSSTYPFAVSGNQVATVDPTSFAMLDRNLMDFTRAVSAAVPVIEGQGGAAMAKALPFSGGDSGARSPFGDPFAGISGLSAYAQDRAVFSNPTASYRDGTSVWARGFAGQRAQPSDGMLLRSANQFYGGMLGVDMPARPGLRLGAFVGAGEARTSIDLNSGDSKSDTVFAGMFAHYTQGIGFLQATIQGGHSSTDSNRNINNNTLPSGLETAKATYGTTYFSPDAQFGLNLALGSLHGASYALTPSIGLRYMFAAVDGYTESGTPANLTVAARNLQDVEERAQLKLTSTIPIAGNKVVMGSVYGGVTGVQRTGGTTVGAELLGQEIPFAVGGRKSVTGGYGGAGIEWRSGNTALFASVEYLGFSDSSSVVSGRGGIRVSF